MYRDFKCFKLLQKAQSCRWYVLLRGHSEELVSSGNSLQTAYGSLSASSRQSVVCEDVLLPCSPGEADLLPERLRRRTKGLNAPLKKSQTSSRACGGEDIFYKIPTRGETLSPWIYVHPGEFSPGRSRLPKNPA